MTKKKKAEIIINKLNELYPEVTIQLNFANPFELLVATILSAQCTDARVNIVTTNLFQKLKSPNDYAEIIVEELEQYIYSTGFYKAKAKNIKETASIIVNKYGGKVPNTMEQLLELPGVGRKTANVVLGHCFNTPGIVVDTHVKRISKRLALTDSEDPVKIEFELMKIINKSDWIKYNHIMINFGREICNSRSPKCYKCLLSEYCEYKIN